MTKVTGEKKTYERTITEALFKTIKMLWRYFDATQLAEQTGFSRPTIDKALNFGHIRDVTLEKAIVEFYKKRAEEQTEQTKEIINLLTKK